jgi:uncharacterized membrane protein YbaN (DUF454 family)
MGDVERKTVNDLRDRGRRRPLSGCRRWLLLAAGGLCLGVGFVGIFLPLVPTTPLVIVAAICFARSSQRAYGWLTSNRLFGGHLRDYLEGKGLAWKARLAVLGFMWLVTGLTALLVVENLAIRSALVVVAVAVTIHVALLRRSSAARSEVPSVSADRGGAEEC